MTLVTHSSTAWTTSAIVAERRPAAASRSRMNARTVASWPSSPGISRVAVGSATSDPTSAQTGVIGPRALDEFPVALFAGERAVADDDSPAAQDDVGRALDLAPFVARVVDVHVVGLGRDRPLAVR